MPFKRLSTSKIAKDVGCHPNTVRLYEKIGFIAPVPRSPSGYRLYTQDHLDQMRLARLSMQGAYAGPNIRKATLAVIRSTATGDYPAALDLAHHYLGMVRLEREQAEAAAAFLEQWASGSFHETGDRVLRITQAARLLNLSTDVLRSWDRDGLINVPRAPSNRYRLYRPVEIGRLRVIRFLRQSGYSLMAVLRMLTQLDRAPGGGRIDVRQALDTPRPDEDVYMASDRWLSTLTEQEQRARQVIQMLEEMVERAEASPVRE